MGRPPCCDKANVKRGLWTAEEDAKILAYVANHGTGNWTLVPKKAGLNRCGKSCRLRWTNYLRPDLKHESFSPQEEDLIIELHKAVGSRWSLIAKQLPGRTDNDVKNYWNTKLKKKLMKMEIDPITHKPFSQIFSDYNRVSFRTNHHHNHHNPQTRSTPTGLIASSSHTSLPSPILPPIQPHSQLPIFTHFQEQLIEIQAADEVSPASSCSSSSSSSMNNALQRSSVQALLDQPVVNQSAEGNLLQYDVFGGLFDVDNGEVKDNCYNNFESETSSGCRETSSFVKAILDQDNELQLDLLALNEFLDY